jgi:glycosyltransferase involved in cell wall biosynthesis
LVHEVLVSVVIPALNEAENLPHVLPRIPSWVHEVILVDGYSSDNTVEIAKELMPNIRIVWQEGTGKGAALRTGVKAATGEIVIMLDADGSTDPGEIPAFVGALLAGADLVKGSRFVQGGGTADMPPLRQWGNWCFVVLANVLFGTRFSDITYGYRGAWRHCLDMLALEIDGWENETVGNIRAARAGLRVAEVPSYEYRRIGGEAKLQTFPAGWVILKGMLAEGIRAARVQGVRRWRAPELATGAVTPASDRAMVLTK